MSHLHKLLSTLFHVEFRGKRSSESLYDIMEELIIYGIVQMLVDCINFITHFPQSSSISFCNIFIQLIEHYKLKFTQCIDSIFIKKKKSFSLKSSEI